LNRIDRVTASNFSREINYNYCKNIIVKVGGIDHMLQIASLYCREAPWSAREMGEAMLDVAKTALKVVSDKVTP
jgi:hypothetical protein